MEEFIEKFLLYTITAIYFIALIGVSIYFLGFAIALFIEANGFFAKIVILFVTFFYVCLDLNIIIKTIKL